MKYFLFILGTLILSTSACTRWAKKYPEDTERTKKTPTERLTGKWWTLKKVTLNGIDYTDTVKNTIGEYKLYFTTQEDHEMLVGSAKSEYEGGFGTIWIFYKSETYLAINRAKIINNIKTFAPCYETGFFGNISWGGIILKLNERELKMSFNPSNHDTIIINEFISE